MIAGSMHAETEGRLAAVQEHMAAGLSLKESAARLAVTPRTVSRLRARLRGYTLPPAPIPTPEQIKEWDRLLTEGWSFREIARTHNVHENTIARRFPGRGWDPAARGQLGFAVQRMNNLPTRGRCQSRRANQSTSSGRQAAAPHAFKTRTA